jgi:hypothetical protein
MDSVPIDVKFFEILSGNKNPIEVITEYEETCFSFAKSSSSESELNGIKQFVDKKQKQISQEESNTWLLWKIIQENASKERKSLFDVCSMDPLVGFNCSKKSLAHGLENSNPELNKTYYVKEWLQKIYWRNEGESIQQIPDDLSNQSMWSLEKKETITNTTSLQSVHDQEKLVDPNGSLVLCEKAWSFVRSGREADAIKLFEGHGQAWRAAMMFGNELPSDSYFDQEESDKAGNAYYNLFKKTLLSILGEPTSDLNLFERAIMGTQAAHLKSILGACRTWEDYLWAHYFVKHEAQKNLELENYMKLNGSYLDEDDSSITYQPIWTEGEIFTSLQSCEEKAIKEMSFAPYHYIQTSIILSLYDELVETLAIWARKIVLDLGTVAGEGELIQNLAAQSQHLEVLRENSTLCKKEEGLAQSLSTLATILTVDQGALFVEGSVQHRVPTSILRFAVHLIMYLDRHGIWQFTAHEDDVYEVDGDNVLNAAAIFQAYASYLSTIGQLKLVPFYLSFFPNLTVPYNVKILCKGEASATVSKKILFSTSTYATLLLRDPQVVGKEAEYLKIARDHGLDTLAIMTHIVDLLLDSFDEHQKNYVSMDEKELEIVDQNLINLLRWLSYDEKQSFEILKQSNRLIRKFLVNNRPRSAKATFTYLEERLSSNYRSTLEQWICTPNLTLNNVAALFHPKNQNNPAFFNGKPLVNSVDLKQKFIDALTQIKTEAGIKTAEEMRDIERKILFDIKREFIDNNEANLEHEMEKYILGVEIQNSIREHLSLYYYLHVLKLFEEWTALTIKYSFVQFSPNEEAMTKLSQNDVQLMVELESNLDKILKCNSGWLLDPPSSAPKYTYEEPFSIEMRVTRTREIRMIRTMVIPNALAILHDIFSYTGKITSCIELANLATDDQYKLLNSFPKEDSSDLIRVILRSQVKDMETTIKSNQ